MNSQVCKQILRLLSVRKNIGLHNCSNSKAASDDSHALTQPYFDENMHNIIYELSANEFTKKEKIVMFKCISKEEIKEKEKNGCVLVASLNCNNCVTSDTKLVIVGTITPPEGQNNGYFYTAPKNRIYGYLDEALGTKLKPKKLALSGASDEDKREIITEIKHELVAKGIAFLDVIKYAIHKNEKEDSCYDSDIEYYCLDYQSFQNIPAKARFICNSKAAWECFEKICKKNGREDFLQDSHSMYLPQRGKGSAKDNWLKGIKNFLS